MRTFSNAVAVIVFSSVLAACGGGGGGGSTGGGGGTTGGTNGGTTGGTNGGTTGGTNGGTTGGSTATPDATLGANQGQVLLGPVVGAFVFVYDLGNLEGAPICTATTSSADAEGGPGIVDLSSCSLTADQLYFVVARDGNDIDADDDGVLDTTPTPKQGALRALITGEQISQGGWRVNLMTELGYNAVAHLLLTGAEEAELLSRLNLFTHRLIRTDLNGDGIINETDLLAFVPERDRAGLSERDTETLDALLEAILSGDYNEVTSLARQHLLASLGEVEFIDDAPGFVLKSYVVNDGLLYAFGYMANPGSLVPNSNNLALRIFDISDFANVELLGEVDIDIDIELDPRSVGEKLVESAGYVYVAATGVGLLVFDVSDASNPALATTYTGAGTEVDQIAVGGGSLYLGNSARETLYRISLSDPAAPSPGTSIPQAVHGIAYSASASVLYADVAGLASYDAESLAELDHVAAPGSGNGHLAFKDGFAYIPTTSAVEGFQSIEIYDATSPYAITYVGRVSGAGLVQSLAILNDRLHAKTEDALTTFQITTPGQLQLIDSRSTTGHAVVADSDRIYVGDLLRVAAFSQESLDSQPHYLAKFDTEKEAKSIRIEDTLAYVADSNNLLIFDLSDLSNGIGEPLGSFSAGAYIEDFDIVDGYAYLAASTEELIVVNISNPASPTEVGQLLGNFDTEDGNWGINRIAVYNDTAYVNVESGSLAIYDVSDPAVPTLIKEMEGSNWQQAELRISGQTLFMTLRDSVSGNFELRSYSLATPENPEPTDSLMLNDQGVETGLTGLAINDGYAYLTTRAAGLIVVNISNPGSLVETGRVPGLGSGNAVAVAEGMAYVANEFGLVDVFDVSDRFNPVFLSQFNFAGTVKDVAVTADHIFAVNVFGLVVERTVSGADSLQ